MMKYLKGTTIIEVVLVIGLMFAVILLFRFFSFRSAKVENDLTISLNAVVNSLKRAQFKAINSINDNDWGVKINIGKITLFKGTSFSGRDSSFDEIILFPSSISVTGLSEVFFNKFSGLPNATGTVTIGNLSSQFKVINLNENGVPLYQ